MLISPVPDDDKSGTLQLALDDMQLNDGINAIRERVSAWRDGGYQGATSVTVRLLEHGADERGPVTGGSSIVVFDNPERSLLQRLSGFSRSSTGPTAD